MADLQEIAFLDFQDHAVVRQTESSANLVRLEPEYNYVGHIYYEGGTIEDREAKILAYEGRDRLAFEIRGAGIIDPIHAGHRKGRIQLDIQVPSPGYARLTEQKSFRLSSKMGNVNPGFGGDYLMISEWRTGRTWLGEYAAMINTNLYRHSNGALYLVFGMQSQNPEHGGIWSGHSWVAPVKNIPIPVGEWINLYTSYDLAGGTEQGQFRAYIQLPGEGWRFLTSYQGYVTNPDGPVWGVRHIQPCKMYAGSGVIDPLIESGGRMAMLWDDVVIFGEEVVNW